MPSPPKPPARAAARPSPGAPAWSRRDTALALALAALLFVAYHPAWHGAPLWDDDGHLTPASLASWGGLYRIWFELGATQQYYPLTHSVFWLERMLFGESVIVPHLVNVALHATSAVLVVRVLRRLEIPGAWLAAATWAAHPVMVESVAWMTELKNTLSGVFYLAAALAYLGFDRTRARRAWALAFGLFLCALASKSVTSTLPAALLLALWLARGRLDPRRDVRPIAPFFVVGVTSGLFTAWVERTTIIGPAAHDYGMPLLDRFLLAGRVFWFYLGKLAWPAELVFIYPRWTVTSREAWQLAPAVAAVALLAVLVAKRVRWGRGPLVAALFFGGTLFPALGFIDVFPFRFSYVADHFQYLASLGPIALAAAGAARLAERRRGADPRAIGAAGAAVPALLAALTFRQSATYVDKETLWRATLARNPDCWLAHYNLGAEYAAQQRFAEAIESFRSAARVAPRDADTSYSLGTALLRAGRRREAIDELRRTVAIEPRHATARSFLGRSLLEEGRADEAIVELSEVVRQDASLARARRVLALALADRGRAREAADEARRALAVAEARGDAELAATLRADLARYEAPAP